MGRFFSYDGGLMQTLSKLFDCICLAILWIICCVPIFTVGAIYVLELSHIVTPFSMWYLLMRFFIITDASSS